MYSDRDSYVVTNESHHIAGIAAVTTAATVGAVFKTSTFFVGGIELFMASVYGFLAYLLLGVIHDIRPGSATGIILWLVLTIVFVALWMLTLDHLTKKRLMPTFILISICLAVFSYMQIMDTRIFDGGDWLFVGLICIGVFYLAYRLSLKMVTTKNWHPHKYYSLDGDDGSWKFIEGGGRIKGFVVMVGGFAYLLLLFIAPILVAIKAYRLFI